eukprot:PhM_4_TR17851/c0_g1_i1/m.14136
MHLKTSFFYTLAPQERFIIGWDERLTEHDTVVELRMACAASEGAPVLPGEGKASRRAHVDLHDAVSGSCTTLVMAMPGTSVLLHAVLELTKEKSYTLANEGSVPVVIHGIQSSVIKDSVVKGILMRKQQQ